MSLVAESDVRTDWLSGTEVTMIDDVIGVVVLWESRVTQAIVILSLAFQSSSLSSVRARVRMVTWVAQCWFDMSGGRRLAIVGLLRTNW